jgi:hypothetical protein
MRARQPPSALDECLASSARAIAAAKDHLAKIQFRIDSILRRIERSAETIKISQALLAKMQDAEDSN